jgi:hypothetical protein
LVALAGGIVEVLIHKVRRRSNAPDGKGWLTQAVQRGSKGLHVRDFAGHEELEGVLGSDVITEIDQPLIDDLGAGLGGDVAAEVDIELASDLQIVGRPRISL